MRGSNFKQRLQKWANETANFYHEMTEIHDLAFYTQSDLNKVSEYSELLILGINPGSGGRYKADQIEKPIWQEWGVNGRMDGITLLKGNPCMHEKEKWRIWQGLTRVFSRGSISYILNDEGKYAWSNIIFLNTPKEKNIERELYRECPKQTLKLIEILKPKRILCLSIRSCFDVLKNEIKDHEVVIDSYLEKGKLLNIPIYGIRHTSYGNAGEWVVSKCLIYLFDREPQSIISKDEICQIFADEIQKIKEKKSNPSKDQKEKIVELCVEELKKKWRLHDEKNNRFSIADDRLSLTITSSDAGYIAIRYLEDADNKQSDIIEILEKCDFHSYHDNSRLIWLGKKNIKDFEGNTPEDIFGSIISELTKMVSELDRIYT